MRKARARARTLVQLGKAAGLLGCHHGSSGMAPPGGQQPKPWDVEHPRWKGTGNGGGGGPAHWACQSCGYRENWNSRQCCYVCSKPRGPKVADASVRPAGVARPWRQQYKGPNELGAGWPALDSEGFQAGGRRRRGKGKGEGKGEGKGAKGAELGGKGKGSGGEPPPWQPASTTPSAPPPTPKLVGEAEFLKWTETEATIERRIAKQQGLLEEDPDDKGILGLISSYESDLKQHRAKKPQQVGQEEGWAREKQSVTHRLKTTADTIRNKGIELATAQAFVLELTKALEDAERQQVKLQEEEAAIDEKIAAGRASQGQAAHAPCEISEEDIDRCSRDETDAAGIIEEKEKAIDEHYQAEIKKEKERMRAELAAKLRAKTEVVAASVEELPEPSEHAEAMDIGGGEEPTGEELEGSEDGEGAVPAHKRAKGPITKEEENKLAAARAEKSRMGVDDGAGAANDASKTGRSRSSKSPGRSRSRSPERGQAAATPT